MRTFCSIFLEGDTSRGRNEGLEKFSDFDAGKKKKKKHRQADFETLLS